MKKLIALLLTFICLIGVAIGESPATPTDIYEEYVEEIIEEDIELDDIPTEYMEFEDDDAGYIDVPLERKVYIVIDKEPKYMGDTVVFVAVLIDFKPDDIITFEWQYAESETSEWNRIEGATEQTYTFELNGINMHYLYRVVVTWEGE